MDNVETMTWFRAAWLGLICGISALAVVACAELTPVTDKVESALDTFDAGLYGLSATYERACPTTDRPSYCDDFRLYLNTMIGVRNELVSK